MTKANYYSDEMTLYRDNYQSRKEYLKDYQDACKYFGYKVRVVGGWKFFTFKQDYDLWKRTK